MVALVLAFCLPFAAVADTPPAAPLRVVASFSILGDMVRQIGGSDVKVDTLVGPDGDAHEYEPTPADARALSAAQVLVINGLGFETWMNRLVKTANFKGMTVIASEGVQPRDFEDDDVGGHEHKDGTPGDGKGEGAGRGDAGHGDTNHGNASGGNAGHGNAGGGNAGGANAGGANAGGGNTGHGHADSGHADSGHADSGHAGRGHATHLDPHAWQSLSNGVLYARNIGAALAKADPAHADAYRQRTDAYVARIQALDQRVKQAFAALPAERRRVVTSHDAFGYFGQAYGVDFISTMGISTDAEPSAADVARIIDQVKREKVPAVFLENVSNPRLGQRIAQETGAKLGGTLYSDALAKPGLPAATYLGMFEWNLAAFMSALKP
jgi:zinc/manganese transport system substrate-binding protein